MASSNSFNPVDSASRSDSDEARPGVDSPRMARPSPVSSSERLESLDVLRGFALLGILAMNIRAMAAPFAAYM
jgi:hypothetical protein